MTLAILEHEAKQSVIVMNNSQPVVIQKESAEELLDNNKDILIIDVRDADEYEKNHIRNAINIPYKEIDSHIEELMQYQDKPILIYCQAGNRSQIVAEKLQQLGFTKVYVINDGVE